MSIRPRTGNLATQLIPHCLAGHLLTGVMLHNSTLVRDVSCWGGRWWITRRWSRSWGTSISWLLWLELYSLEKFSCDHLIQEQKNLISNILLTPILTYYIVGILTNFNIEPCRLDKRVESGLFCMNWWASEQISTCPLPGLVFTPLD